MNLHSTVSRGLSARRVRAFTLVEMMVSTAIFSMVVAGSIYAHLMGLKLYNLALAKLGASDQARVAVGKMMDDIRAGKLIAVGQGDQNSFTQCTNGALQQGTSIQIYMTTNYTTNFIRYFIQTNTAKLQRTVNGSTSMDMVAENITNKLVFTSEDFSGNVLTAGQNNRVIGVLLQFYQIQYPIVLIGSNKYYDYYQLQCRVTRRCLE